MRIAVISDVHSTAAPFEKALKAARDETFDQLILLGDLFTYGVDPAACLDLALEAIDQDGALLIGGNHEELYIDLRDSRPGYFDKLPDWIRDSVEWTWQELGEEWPHRLKWIEEWACDGVLFAHANPFGYGDWTYLSDDPRLRAAASTLKERGFRAGVFGHLHRPKYYRDDKGIEVHVVNSIGQPRSNSNPTPSWTMVDVMDDAVSVETRPIDFDTKAAQIKIQSVAGLSADTKSRLCRFYQ
ncbi:MAG: metallophosphoesterase family protein [Erythrobacter sp.]|uniref:metallophosphoesterase family protein n=1 Tax=Erythrobacter sp. TaxID=1042 RepID=UPI002631579E|nr:metallophosphoesterase [Erythrobacter sp.]MDJ0978682.1 metallophosphoesterase family protein [Erythrobacter sp.]